MQRRCFGDLRHTDNKNNAISAVIIVMYRMSVCADVILQ